MFHVKRAVLVLLGMLACADPGDVLYEPEISQPAELAPGLFRLTTGAQPDYARGFLADGTVLFVSSGIPGATAGYGMVQMGLADGVARPIRSVYQIGFPGQRIWAFVPGTQRPVLFALMETAPFYHWCGIDAGEGVPAPPRPPFAGWYLNVLPVTDGVALSSLYQPRRELPVFENAIISPTGRPQGPKRFAEIPPVAEAQRLGANPFGPEITADERYAYVSDGRVIWRYDLADTTASPDSVTEGAYPALDADNRALLLARTTVTDSVETTQNFVYLDWVCVQRYVTYTWGAWSAVRRDLASGVEDTIGEGAEPRWLDTGRIVVRRSDGLYSLTLADGSAQLIVADSTASSPYASPDGSLLTFTTHRFGNADVLLLRLN